MIFTFYSYKGGVGRSLALAHAGYALAERGLRVLLVDFDLEAPGLERYCREGDPVLAMREQPGLIDLILTYRKALTDEAESRDASFRNWWKFVQTVQNPVNSLGGRLDLMTAGARGSADALRDYSLTVRSFDWQDFFHNWSGDRFFEWLRHEWIGGQFGYDVALVDSRTGVTEMGGVCAYQLADVAVLLCAPNFQNLDGTADVARDFLSPGVLGLRRRRPLQLLAVPTRLEADHPRRKEFLDEFEARLGGYLPATLGLEARLSYADLALPYLAQFAVAEPIVGGPRAAAQATERAAFARLREVMGRLASALTLLAPVDSALGRLRPQALAELAGEQARSEAVELQADTRRSSSGFDFFIDFGSQDHAAALELAQRLGAHALQFNVFVDRGAIKVGRDWSQDIERALDYSACVLVCFGASSSSAARDRLLERVRRAGRALVVPVLLPGGNAAALHSFGLDSIQALDLREGIVGEAFERFVVQARARAGGGARDESAALRREPYRGLAPSTEDDAGFFFGREAELERLLAMVRSSPAVLIQGPAKVGKTSLVEAGLLPALRAAAQGQPALRRGVVFDAAQPGAAWPQWRDESAPAGSDAGFELIVIDTLDALAEAGDAEQRALLRGPVEALLARCDDSHRLLLVGRGSALGEPGSALARLWEDAASVMRLEPLAGEAFKLAITQPAQQAEHLLENGLVERLIESAGPARSAVVQVQLTLRALWQARRDGWLTNRALDALEHLAGVFQRHLAQHLASLAEADRLAAAILFKGLSLIDPSGKLAARPLAWAQVRTAPAVAQVGAERLRELLVAAGLLDLWRSAAADGSEQMWVGLARLDPRAYFGDGLSAADTEFLEWRARLATQVAQWQRSGMNTYTLLLGHPLAEAQRWLQQRLHELYGDERAFIEASAARQVVFAVLGARRGRGNPAMAAGQAGEIRDWVQPGSSADEGDTARIIATPGEDIVVLEIANGPTLMLAPEHARDLIMAQADLHRGEPAERAQEAPTTVGLRWRGLERTSTLSGEAAREAFGEARLVGMQLIERVGAVSVAAAIASCDGAVEAGVYALSADELPPLTGSAARREMLAAAKGGPLLILIHGSFVDTVSTFGSLWTQHPARVQDLFRHYGGHVYGFDHPTLGASPIENALMLAEACPQGARLHLLAHSRGALVAEVLARVCGQGASSAADLTWFADDPSAHERESLRALATQVRSKRLRVERVVRVAGAVRGLSFACGRLDVHLSVLRWALGLSGTPVPETLARLTHAVALQRLAPSQFPGLQPMLPGSALLRWLHAAGPPMPGQVRSVAGESDSVMAWFKTLVSDSPGDTATDLVVPTHSMVGGATRTGGESLMFDRGGQVGHYNYFRIERSARAIVDALVQDEPEGFRKLLSPTIDPVRTAARARSVRRPLVFVVPGLFGTQLKLAGGTVALSAQHLTALRDADRDSAVLPGGLVNKSYGALLEFLARDHDVIAFAFDWRRPLEDEARRLGHELQSALDARPTSNQPVRMLAHSTGGLVVRAMQLEYPQVWDRWMAQPGTRVLMLGTPHKGLWAPMQLLSGDEGFGDPSGMAAETVAQAHLRQGFAGFTGLLQAQAGLLDPTLGLDRQQTWQRLADEDVALLRSGGWLGNDPDSPSSSLWGVPTQAVLDQACALQRQLDAQRGPILERAGDLLLVVVGQAELTPTGFEIADSGLVYRQGLQAGDGLVTYDSATLPGVRTWRMACGHFDMTRKESAFETMSELLRDGNTRLLEAVPEPAVLDASVGSVIAARTRRARTPSGFTWPALEAGCEPGASDVAASPVAATAAALRVTVTTGDLKFIAIPLMLGHYQSYRLTGTEAVADMQAVTAMRRALASGVYPAQPGTSRVFENSGADPDNPLALARPPALIVVGLGEEGRLRASELVYAVRTGVVAWAERQRRVPGAATTFELAATLIGTGSGDVGVGNCAQLMAQGARTANEQLASLGLPVLAQLHLIELYHDRACEAWRALRNQAVAAPEQLELVGAVEWSAGALRRSLFAYRGASYDVLAALSGPSSEDGGSIAYTLDTRRSRTQVRAAQRRGTLLEELVARASNDAPHDARIGTTLFQLLVPPELEPFFGGTTEMVLQLDRHTAAIPWELIDTRGAGSVRTDPRPWAIRSKLLRKLQTEEFRAQVSDASPDDNVLVIGEPLCDPTIYPRLDGARKEAMAVAERLTDPGSGIPADRVRSLVDQNDAQTIINALFERPYRVVHIAGHGSAGADGGVVLSGKHTYLGANEVLAMRVVPELVFLNCCHLAGRDATTTLAPYDRAAFAANIAEELIRVGVRCVIAAGWAVEDGPAEKFATAFYAALLGGARFIEAVSAARSAAWRAYPRGNTWAAYQCYGDPEWQWRREVGDAQRPAGPMGDEFADIASAPDLALALETIATFSQYRGANRQRQLDRVRYLDAEYGPAWGAMGAVAEAFGLAYAQTRDIDNAIQWYRAAVDAGDGSASFKAAEQLGNLLVRRGERNKDPAAARADIEAGIGQLERLAAVQSTIERESLLGSAYKRLTMVEWRAGRKARAQAALDAVVKHCGAVEAMARKAGADNLFYPAMNGISAELRAAFLKKRLPQLADDRMKAVSDSLYKAATENPDFWSVVGQIELRILAALAKGRLASAKRGLTTSLRELKARVPAAWMWDSVYNEAQFTLEPYQAVAGADEKRAARDLLAALKVMAAA